MRAKYLAILVGGRAVRMGGVFKGALMLGDHDRSSSILAHLLALAHESGLVPVLVGVPTDWGALLECLPRSEQSAELRHLLDANWITGPLAGLAACCEQLDAPFVLVGCDMPALSAPLITKVASADPIAAVIAARDASSNLWQPLCACYRPGPVLTALHSLVDSSKKRSFQALFAMLPVHQLALSEREWSQLQDWDSPKDCA
jgi:molybdopterin-guanine dinucleotide biosynthesis protein A